MKKPLRVKSRLHGFPVDGIVLLDFDLRTSNSIEERWGWCVRTEGDIFISDVDLIDVIELEWGDRFIDNDPTTEQEQTNYDAIKKILSRQDDAWWADALLHCNDELWDF